MYQTHASPRDHQRHIDLIASLNRKESSVSNSGSAAAQPSRDAAPKPEAAGRIEPATAESVLRPDYFAAPPASPAIDLSANIRGGRLPSSPRDQLNMPLSSESLPLGFPQRQPLNQLSMAPMPLPKRPSAQDSSQDVELQKLPEAIAPVSAIEQNDSAGGIELRSLPQPVEMQDPPVEMQDPPVEMQDPPVELQDLDELAAAREKRHAAAADVL